MLPDSGSEWPPKPLEKVYNDIAHWSAWWSGDPDELSRVYGGGHSSAERSWAERGGLVSAVQRFFWGSPPKPGEQRAKLHMPVASEIAEMSASLLFGQPPTLLVKGDETTQRRLDELAAEEAGAQLQEAAETSSALGQVYLRVGWDLDVDHTGPLTSVVDADAAFPVYRYGRLMQVTFCREWDENGTVLRHLELHERGIIWHAAYMGDHRNLGKQVPLDAHPETSGVVVDGMVADDRRSGSGIETSLDRLDVVGVKNKKTKIWRHIPEARDLGVADISGVEPALDALDDTWTSWMRDVRHGRSRLHVPQHMLDTKGPGQGASFDLDRELYVGLNSPPDGDLQLTPTQFKIRWQEHSETARALVERIVSGAGYSLQTFGLDQSTATQTATEAWARQNRTQNTRNNKIRHWKVALRELSWILLAVDRERFGGQGNPDAAVDVKFADTVSESQLVRAQTAQMLRAADAASTRTLVEMVHNDWDGEEIDAEVERIESAADRPDVEPMNPGELPADDPNNGDPTSHDFPGAAG